MRPPIFAMKSTPLPRRGSGPEEERELGARAGAGEHPGRAAVLAGREEAARERDLPLDNNFHCNLIPLTMLVSFFKISLEN